MVDIGYRWLYKSTNRVGEDLLQLVLCVTLHFKGPWLETHQEKLQVLHCINFRTYCMLFPEGSALVHVVLKSPPKEFFKALPSFLQVVPFLRRRPKAACTALWNQLKRQAGRAHTMSLASTPKFQSPQIGRALPKSARNKYISSVKCPVFGFRLDFFFLGQGLLPPCFRLAFFRTPTPVCANMMPCTATRLKQLGNLQDSSPNLCKALASLYSPLGITLNIIKLSKRPQCGGTSKMNRTLRILGGPWLENLALGKLSNSWSGSHMLGHMNCGDISWNLALKFRPYIW